MQKLALMTAVTFLFCLGPSAQAQEFLKSSPAEKPTFLEPCPSPPELSSDFYNSTDEQDRLMIQNAIECEPSLAPSEPSPPELSRRSARSVYSSLLPARYGVLATDTVNPEPIGRAVIFSPLTTGYENPALPPTTTALVDINIVDSSVYERLARERMMAGDPHIVKFVYPDGSIRIVNLQETPEEAASFIRRSQTGF